MNAFIGFTGLKTIVLVRFVSKKSLPRKYNKVCYVHYLSIMATINHDRCPARVSEDFTLIATHLGHEFQFSSLGLSAIWPIRSRSN